MEGLSPTEAGQNPKEQAQSDAQDQASDNREVEGCVLTFVDDVAGKTSQAKWQFATEIKEHAD
jgi:hypothetical protein